MIELKVRAKHLGEWIEGYFCVYRGLPQILVDELSWESIDDIKTVGRYTGLCDKNGNKVFEGDILCYEDMTKTKYYGVVKYGRFNCSCCHGVYGYWIDGEYLDIRDLDTAYVVGNIHDNPELLEVEE
jgi:uncharacterized phage protein (TIGR01671 family)